jgi:hypothetical protein
MLIRLRKRNTPKTSLAGNTFENSYLEEQSENASMTEIHLK